MCSSSFKCDINNTTFFLRLLIILLRKLFFLLTKYDVPGSELVFVECHKKLENQNKFQYINLLHNLIN